MRKLRHCLDVAGSQDVAVSLAFRPGDQRLATVRPPATSVAATECFETADRELVADEGDRSSLQCTYSCDRTQTQRPPNPAVVPPPGPAPEGTHSSWYGWQTLAADGASLGVFAIGMASWTVEPTVVGYAGFLVATPVVHVVNGNVGRGVGSFVLRLFVPLLAGGIGGAVGLIDSLASKQGDLEPAKIVPAVGIGAGVGAAACIAIDAAALAHKDTKTVGSGTTGTQDRVTLGIRVGQTIGVAGTF
jgi:hypothetical protein